MPIFYNKTERGNPGNPAAPKRWYPVLKSTEQNSNYTNAVAA